MRDPAVAVDLGWAAGALDIRRATIKDARSDVELALRIKGASLEGRYAGSLVQHEHRGCNEARKDAVGCRFRRPALHV